MISDVVIAGELLDNLTRGFRLIDVDTMDAISEKNKHSKIPLLHWTRKDDSRLNRLKKGTAVIIRGRIESDEQYGLHVLVESIYLCN